MLAKALAQYFGAKLLIFDSHSFLGVSKEQVPDIGLSSSFYFTSFFFFLECISNYSRFCPLNCICSSFLVLFIIINVLFFTFVHCFCKS